VAQIITRDPTGTVGARDPLRLSRYLEAYALNSAGITEAKTIYEAAGIDRGTAASYERVLENVFVVESLPAWRTNRLKRLALAPKRYVMDAGVMAILRTDMQAILHDGKLLGRVIATFVAQQLRGDLEVSPARPRLYHLRDQDGRREVDIIAELGGERVLGFEIKAGASVTTGDARHLAWLRDELGDRFVAGAVFHTGPHAFPLGDRITALPISAIWAAGFEQNPTLSETDVGTQWPPWRTPSSASLAASTSAQADRKSTTGVMTFSQSGRNASPCRTRAAFCPGPSNVFAFQPRPSAAAIPPVHAPTTDPSLPLLKISVRRGAPSAVAHHQSADHLLPAARAARSARARRAADRLLASERGGDQAGYDRQAAPCGMACGADSAACRLAVPGARRGCSLLAARHAADAGAICGG